MNFRSVTQLAAVGASSVLVGCAASRPHAPAQWVLGTPVEQPADTGAATNPAAIAVTPIPPTPAPPPPARVAPALREVFPHVRADLANKVVEFDAATSPMLVADPQAPLMFLEVIACTPNTREHETLILTKAKPSHVHAALLLIGLLPGAPGSWKLENDRFVPVDPSGSRIKMEFEWTDAASGQIRTADPLDWIINAKDGRHLREMGNQPGRSGPGWVFAGSVMMKVKSLPDGTPLPEGAPPREAYAADESGTLIGLATFGGETIAWSRTFSPDASTSEPEWIVDFTKTPPPGTDVVIRVRPE